MTDIERASAYEAYIERRNAASDAAWFAVWKAAYDASFGHERDPSRASASLTPPPPKFNWEEVWDRGNQARVDIQVSMDEKEEGK